VDCANVSTVGLKSVAAAHAGLRANETRYFKNNYVQAFVDEPASKAKMLVDDFHRILEKARSVMLESLPLEADQRHIAQGSSGRLPGQTAPPGAAQTDDSSQLPHQ
jgi:hypothetical protein